MRKLIFLILGGTISMVAQASYLYWQVDPDVQSSYGGASYNSARITYLTGSESLSEYAPYNNTGITIYDSEGNSTDYNPSSGGPYLASGTFNEGYTYFIELYNSGTLVARSAGTSGSEMMTYTNAAAQGGVTSMLNPIAISSANIWHGGGSYKAVPEPTSGLMLLLGAAMLGLKRKNRSIA